MKNINKVGAFTRMCCTIGNLPSSYMISMTYEEQLLWLCNFLEKNVIPAVNNNAEAVEELQRLFIQLKEYVDEYFDDLNIQTEIDNKLDEMALDGTLERIINEELFSDLNDTITATKETVDTIEPIVYENEKNVKFPTYNLGIERIFRFIEDDTYLSMQGYCITPYNTIIVALWESGTNNNKIVEINYTTGQVIKQATPSYGYCNGLTLDPINNLVYVIPRGDANDDNLRTIKVLNYSDFSLQDTIIFDDYLESAYFDKDTNKLYVMNEWGLRENNGFKIYELDDNLEISDTIELDYSGEIDKLRIQNFAIHNNFIYVLSSDPKCLLVYNMNGTLFKKYNLDDMIDNLYYAGEYQDIDFLNNKCYITSADNVPNIESINQLFLLDLEKEYINTTDVNTIVHNGYAITLYVDASSTAINPDGSENNKFKSINEATRYQGACNIQVADGTYNGIDIRSKLFKNITGASSNTIVKGINMSYCSNCFIENITINEDMFSNSGFINLYETDVTFKGITISGNKYGIYVGAKSKCKLSSGVDLSGITADNQIYVRSESVLYTPSTDYKIQKHNKSANVIGGVKMFETDKAMCTGSFNFDNNSNYIFADSKSFKDYYKYIDIVYTIAGNSTYVQRYELNSSSNTMQMSFTNMNSSGVKKTSTCVVDFNNEKFRIRYSRVGTTTNAGVTTIENNSDNDNPVSDSIIINNCILY